MRRGKLRSIASMGALNLFFIALCFVTLIPILYALSVALSGQNTLLSSDFSFIPRSLTLDNFRAVFRAWGDFIRWHGALARKRREIRANRKGSAAENIYRGSVVLRYLFGRRTFGGMMR